MRTQYLSCLLGLASVAVAQGEMQLHWKLELPAREYAWSHTSRMRRDVAYPLAVHGKMLLIGCEHNGTLLAVDMATKQEQWRFYTGAPIRVAPESDGKRVFVSSDDGCLYALDGAGTLLWRFRGGPSERKVIGHQRLISAWPGGPVKCVGKDRVIFIAGHWPCDGVYIHALEAASGHVVWTNSAARYRPSDLVQVDGDKLFVYGYGGGGVYDLETGRELDEKRPPVAATGLLSVPEQVAGDVVDTRMIDGRMIVVTAQGSIYCFTGHTPSHGLQEAQADAPSDSPNAAASGPLASETARLLLDKTRVREGYALVLGLDNGTLVEGLLRGSKMRVTAVDSNAKTVDAVRRRLDVRGLFDDHRLSIYQGDPAAFGSPPYFADLITSETTVTLTDELRESLHPNGGTFAVADGDRLKLQCRGPVAGGGGWTHEYADAANSLSSDETLARAPLGILWYEGPAGDARFYFDGHVDHQSGHSVSPLPPGALILDGRMILQGPGRLGAFDIYTGRLLWEAELPEVYGFGGPDGGLGVHSRKHREPWRYEPALQAEIPATHHSRATGLNYASAGDDIYICAGRELLCFSAKDGSRRSTWTVPLTETQKETLCWGSVRVVGERLVATAFRPQDLVDAQCGHDGNGGDWAKDRMPMRYLIVLDRESGRLVWSRRAEFGFLNRGIAVGKDTVFCVDSIAPQTLEKLREAKRNLPSGAPTLYALDLDRGDVRWQFKPEVPVLNLTYAQHRDILIVPCRNLMIWEDGRWMSDGDGPPKKNAPGRMWALRSRDGQVMWSVDEAPYFEPHIVLDDMILDRYGYSYDLTSGKRDVRASRLTGQDEPWHFHKSGCNHLVACPTLVTWRTAYYDLADHSGLMPLDGMNAGCTATMLPAGGVLNVPNFGTHHKRSRMTALAMVHRPNNALWTQYHSSREKVMLTPVAIRRAGFNFGAPGDRIADDGTMWLSVTARKSENVEILPKGVTWFQMDAARTGSWVASSGVWGASNISIPMLQTADKYARRADSETRRYDVRLHFVEPDPIEPGERVFTVSLEGKPILVDLDIARAARNPCQPLTRELKNVEVHGALDLIFEASKGEPLLCGVEVIARKE
jgi:outer membrane protein assembly factor BamB